MACAGETDLNMPLPVFGASIFLAIVGFADDVKSIPVLPRLMLQAVAVGAIVFTASDDLRIVPACPLWIERGLLLLAGLWFVNLVNFMDGLDWMTVAEVVPVTGAIVILGWLGELPLSTTIVAAALCGAMVGFAPFNRPVATIFLGDVGSLPIGLLLGLVPVAAVVASAIHRRVAAAAVLFVGCHRDAVAPAGQARAVLGGASFAFLSARNRQRIYGFAGSGRSVHTQYRPCNIGDRINRRNIYYDEDPMSRAGGLAAASLIYRFARRHPSPEQLPLHHAGCQAQPFIESDRGPPAGCCRLRHIELKGANDAVMHLGAAAHLSSRLSIETGKGKRRSVTAGVLSRLTNSGVETCSASATRNTSNSPVACASRCTTNELRFSTARNARRFWIDPNGSGMPSCTA